MRNNIRLITIALLLLQCETWAKDIEIQPSISTKLDYSDNVDLDESNEKDDFILRVTPSIHLKKEGGRVKSTINYSLSGLFFASESDNNGIQHRLLSNATAELVKHSFFLDLDAGISQELLDPNLSASSDGVSGSRNLTETYTYGFSPYWQKKWGKYAESTLRYDYNEVKFSGGNSSDSVGENIHLDVSSGRVFDLITWDLSHTHRETRYDSEADTTSDVTKLVFGYHYSRQLKFRFTTGYEDYDSTYISPGDGWAIGVTWDPSPRDSVDLDIGHRFYGDAYKFDYKHRGKRITWNVTYNEDVTNQRNQIRDNNQEREENPDNIIAPIATNRNQAELYLSRRLNSNLTYSYRKSSINWGVYNERRYYEDADNEDEDNYGTNLSWSWRIGKRTTMKTNLGWSLYDDVIEDNSQTRTELALSLDRRITPDTSGFFRISYRKNDADTNTDDYTEHRVSVGLNKHF